jgi:hypothetical protein
MTAVFGILFFLIVLGSLTTTFVAIFQIINNDINGSKGLWIIISMIAIIGPILYLTKGRKLIVKRDYSEINNGGGFSFKSHYSGLLRDLSTNVKIAFATAFGLIITGYLVRGFDIYVFWESKPIGYAIFLICIVILLRKDITKRKSLKVKNAWSHIGFWVIGFILFVKTLITIILPNSDAYKAAKNYLNKDYQLKSEIGEIKGYTVLPSGGIETSSGSNGTYGAASIALIIKGTEKYKELVIYVEKTPDTDWTVAGIE